MDAERIWRLDFLRMRRAADAAAAFEDDPEVERRQAAIVSRLWQQLLERYPERIEAGPSDDPRDMSFSDSKVDPDDAWALLIELHATPPFAPYEPHGPGRVSRFLSLESEAGEKSLERSALQLGLPADAATRLIQTFGSARAAHRDSLMDPKKLVWFASAGAVLMLSHGTALPAYLGGLGPACRVRLPSRMAPR